MNGIKESDWKHLRQLTPVALERFCNRVLAEVERTLSNPEKTSHERYLAVHRLIQNRDDELGRIFNDLRRSNATGRLFLMRQSTC